MLNRLLMNNMDHLRNCKHSGAISRTATKDCQYKGEVLTTTIKTQGCNTLITKVDLI